MARHNSTAAIRRQGQRRYERQFASPTASKHEVVNVVVPSGVQRFEGVPTSCGFCGAGRVLCRHRAAVL